MGQGSIIGYEINEKTCQISFYNDKEMEPQTLEVDADNRVYNIEIQRSDKGA